MTTLEVCRACGTEWSTGSRFCPNCDAIVGSSVRPDRPNTVTTAVPNYVTLSLVTVLFCWPTAIVAMWFASRANHAAARGATGEGLDLAATSRKFCVISFAVPVVLLLALGLLHTFSG